MAPRLYRLKHGMHIRREDGRYVIYHAGDTFVPTDRELAVFRDKLEPVPEPELVKDDPVREEVVEATVTTEIKPRRRRRTPVDSEGE